jgi:hypothetical protein
MMRSTLYPTSRPLATVFQTKAQIRREIGTNSVGVEYDRIEQRSKRGGECRLAGARKSHDKNFASHSISCQSPASKTSIPELYSIP